MAVKVIAHRFVDGLIDDVRYGELNRSLFCYFILVMVVDVDLDLILLPSIVVGTYMNLADETDLAPQLTTTERTSAFEQYPPLSKPNVSRYGLSKISFIEDS